MTRALLTYAAFAWWAIGFLLYVILDVRHRRDLERRYQPTRAGFFPAIGLAELFSIVLISTLGPLLLLVGYVARHRRPAQRDGISAAAASRRHPVQETLGDDPLDDDGPPLKVAR